MISIHFLLVSLMGYSGFTAHEPGLYMMSSSCAIENAMMDSLFISHPSLAAGEDSLYYYPTWNEQLELNRKTGNVLVPVNPATATWHSSNPSVATVVGGRVNALTNGTATITVELNNTIKGTVGIRVHAPSRPPVVNALSAAMKMWGNTCAIRDMPVLIIRYLPTSNGTHLDVNHAPDFHDLGPITLTELEQRLVDYDHRIKFALEEGSRFRDYGHQSVNPYLGYRAVAMITVYEPSPRGKVLTVDVNGLPIYGVDFFSMFERWDVEDFVRNMGVKEIWFWQYGMDSGYPTYDAAIHPSSNFRLVPESNMASPFTGDVSNSYQVPDDLPIYDKTYIVYGQNIRRSQGEAIHNHGHQIERMIPYFNERQDGNAHLFWRRFVGQDAENNFIAGRCGWTHMPPNTTTPYDYENSTSVLSDIKDWKPMGGVQSLVNVNTWGGNLYNWPGVADFPQRKDSQWYIYWFQSIPGHLNTINYNSSYLSNWWEIIADWDKAYQENYKLYRFGPDSVHFAQTHLAAEICEGESYSLAGMEFNEADDYVITLQNGAGCDSVIRLTLNVLTEVYQERDEFICDGESFVLNGEFFTESGDYDVLIDGLTGCDTVVLLDLQVIALDPTILLQGSSLFASENGVTYQWFDCFTGFEIPGATNRVFHPTMSGQYAVELVSPEGCHVTSGCINVTITAVEGASPSDCVVFPNPSDGRLYMQLEGDPPGIEVILYDAMGNLLSAQPLVNGCLDLRAYDAGVYWLTLMIEGRRAIRKFSLVK
jgi:hypothetical protein